jgi:hypothetical protein
MKLLGALTVLEVEIVEGEGEFFAEMHKVVFQPFMSLFTSNDIVLSCLETEFHETLVISVNLCNIKRLVRSSKRSYPRQHNTFGLGTQRFNPLAPFDDVLAPQFLRIRPIFLVVCEGTTPGYAFRVEFTEHFGETCEGFFEGYADVFSFHRVRLLTGSTGRLDFSGDIGVEFTEDG